MRAGSNSFISAPYLATERQDRSGHDPTGLLDRKRSADDWSVAKAIASGGAWQMSNPIVRQVVQRLPDTIV